MTMLSDWIEFNPRVQMEKGKTYPFVSMDVLLPGSRFVSAEQERTFTGSGAKFSKGDTLFARITPCLENGKISQFVDERGENGAFGSTEFFVLRAIPGKSTPAYVYYLSQTDLLRGVAVKSMVGASGRQRADVKVLRELELEAPPLDVQVQVGTVLSAYDALIATNQRRIALLEEAARRLYREWFVHLRFPGYEAVKVADGVPEGWARKTLGEIAPLKYGKALKATERKDGRVPVYGSSGVVGHHDQPFVDAGAIVVGRKGNVGSLYFSHEPCFPIDTVFFIDPDASTFYLLQALSNLNFISSDAAVPGLNRNYAHSLPLLVPDGEVAAAFETLVEPLYSQAFQLKRQKEKLAEARDALLPKLMGGKLDVSPIPLPQPEAA